ncbi:MAG: Asp-tRNA(Asn)/Glu-tRNA(Gln) amidotransferase subunit GatA [Anaerolineales bacterium]|nr:Asp-tRNA(Asn)/Glu-tRNA(Gln) amidotransferase subunit GatA [Anaerolineales bacterium]
MSSLTELSLKEMQTGLREGQFSSRELVEAALERIKQLEPSLHTFLHVAESALQHAEEADRQLTSDRQQLPLAGIPIAVKDVLTVEGMPATAGSKILEGFMPPYTATTVKKLQEAGTIIIGKTNMDEFAMGSSTENSAYGATYNPWDLTRVPGGSSGGSAAAVAARLVPVALGTDTGGSVRQPASFCGVTGLKPTYGRVSRYGLIAFGSSLDCVGAFGRTAEDVAVIFEIMAGHDPLDATSAEVEVVSIRPTNTGYSTDAPLRGLRIGVPQEYFIEGMQAEVQEKTRAAIAQLESLGAEVQEISLPHTEYALPVYYILAPAEASANLARFDGVRYGPRVQADSLWEVFFKTRGEKFGAEVTRRIMLGTYALSAGYYDAYYGQAQKVRTLIKRDFETAFEKVDLIACPSAPTTAFKIGAHTGDPLAMYLEDVFTLPASLAGVPGISFPVGFDSIGLPIGMQLLASHFREDLLFRATYAYQQATDWHKQKPNM